MLSGLEYSSIIIMDNMSYHSKYKEKYTSQKQNEAKIEEWLTSKGLTHDPNQIHNLSLLWDLLPLSHATEEGHCGHGRNV